MNKNKSVLVFRKSILPYSETFVVAQGRFLKKYKPVFAGFKNVTSGRSMLADFPCLVLEDYVKNIHLAKLKHRLGYINKKWLEDIKQNSPSLIHAHFLNDGLDALAIRDRLSLPLITTLHGHDIAKTEKFSLIKKDRKYFFDKVDKVIAVSDYIYNCALKNGCPEDKLVKHFIGIDIEKFTKDKNESATPGILFVGRLVEKKGCIYLLQAMVILKKKHPELKLTIVGDGPLYKELHAFVQAEDLNVVFVGKKTSDEICTLLSKTWVFVAPSITAESGDAEGLAMVFLEAQALRTPVVSYSSGGISQAVDDGVTGILKNEKNVLGLAESIEYFIENNNARKEFGDRGRDRVENLFDVRKQCRLLEDIYDSVL